MKISSREYNCEKSEILKGVLFVLSFKQDIQPFLIRFISYLLKGRIIVTLKSINDRWKASIGIGLGKFAGKLKEISINKLEVSPDVFQPRFVGDDPRGVQSKDHVFALTKRLQREGSLDPLLVLPVGDKAIVIDGHHRLEAYKKANLGKVRVHIFEGDPHTAKLASATENQKARLQMSGQERTQSAWNLVKAGLISESPPRWVFSENQIIQATSASDGTIKTMRTIFKEFQSKGMDVPDSWITARTGVIENRERDWDAELAKQVDAYRKILLKHFPTLATSRKREAFALAVVSFSPQSTQEILRHILSTDEGKDALEAFEEEAEDLEDSDF